jgi:hypothetical protein
MITNAVKPLRSWTATPPPTPLREFNATSASLAQIRAVLGQLIADLGEKSTVDFKNSTGTSPNVDNPADYTGEYLDVIESDGPDDPPEDRLRLYAKDDDNLYYKNSDGVETKIGAIEDGSITYAKIQDVSATDKVLGRKSAGAGPVEEIVCTAIGRAVIAAATSAALTALLDAATTGAQGVVELATGAEALGGSDATRALTGAGLASALSLSNNGYITLPGGIIIQWGTNPSTGGNFPTAFPLHCNTLILTPIISDGDRVVTLKNSPTAFTSSYACTTTIASSGGASTVSHAFLAIGR